MAVTRKYPKEEFARRGGDDHEDVVKPKLRPEDHGRFVAVDIDSQDFKVGDDELEICDRLRDRQPEAQIWIVRVGSRWVHKLRRAVA